MKIQIPPNTRIELDDAGQGDPIVLLHAFPLSRAMWRPQVQALHGSYRVIVPDQRGFGGSDGFDAAPSVERMADDVAALLDALKIDGPVVVAGLSMGGYVALAFARRHPARLKALILADTRSEADTPEGRSNRDTLIRFAQTHTAQDVIGQMLPKLLGADTRQHRPALVEEVRRIGAAQMPTAIVGALQALRDRPDATPGLSAIAVPTLVLVGTEDAITPPSAAEDLTRRIPGARLTTIPGAGHLANLEQPESFNDALKLFLRGLP